MARTHYIAGNWKMNTTKAEAVAGVVIALITVFIISRKYKNNGKENIYDLNSNSKTTLTRNNDIFLTKSVSVTTIQSDSGLGSSGLLVR